MSDIPPPDDRAVTFHRDFRDTPSIEGLATRYAWDRGTIINGESQFYLDPAWAPKWIPFSFDERGLAITARETPEEHGETNMPYVSGVLTSNGDEPFGQRYGNFTVVATLPDAKGAFVAPLWLLPMDWQALKSRWPDEGVLSEIDVVENVGEARQGVYHVTVHTRGAGGPTLVAHSKRIETGVDLAAGPHAYGVEWTGDWLVFLFDGAETWRFPTPSDMHDERHWLSNFAVGGSWAGPPDPADYPASMIVQSITVLAPLDGEPPPTVGAPSDGPASRSSPKAIPKAASRVSPGPAAPDAMVAARAALEKYRAWYAGEHGDAPDGIVATYGRWLASEGPEAVDQRREAGLTADALLAAVAELEG